jgi:hypothetical protein
MKKILTIILIINLSVLHSQQMDLKAKYGRKVYQYTTIKDIALMGGLVGAALTVTGIALDVQGSEIANHQQYNNGYTQTGYKENIYSQLAPVFTVVGVYALGGAVVMTIISHKKIIKYKDMQDHVTVNFNLTPTVKGLAFTYRF